MVKGLEFGFMYSLSFGNSWLWFDYLFFIKLAFLLLRDFYNIHLEIIPQISGLLNSFIFFTHIVLFSRDFCVIKSRFALQLHALWYRGLLLSIYFVKHTLQFCNFLLQFSHYSFMHSCALLIAFTIIFLSSLNILLYHL